MTRFSVAIHFLFLFFAPAWHAYAAPATDASGYMDERPTQKLALVVGNSHYSPQPPIPSSAVDATKIAAALRGLGFAVTEVHDIKRGPDFWENHFQVFVDKIKENDFVVVYFSGHGLNYEGENFLAMTELPTTIPEADVRVYLIALSGARNVLAARKPGLSLFLLDACRTVASNIEKSDGRVEGVNKGMTQLPNTVENVAIGLSSDFGKVSKGRDVDGAMSYYTDALVAHLSEEGQELGYVKRKTRLKVIADTKGDQIPWFSESVSAEIYLKPTTQIDAQDKTVWFSRLNTNDYMQIWNFTQEYPVSRYVAAAKRWLAQHRRVGVLQTLSTTKLPPHTLDLSFDLESPGKRVVVPRVDGPYGFPTLGQSASANVVASATKVTEVLAGYTNLVVTKNVNAKISPDDSSETVQTVAAGSTVAVKDIATMADGKSWVEVMFDQSSAFLPADRAVVGKSDVGYSLEELEVGQSEGLESLVDEKPIRDAVADLRAKGNSISRVSVATTATEDKRLRVKLNGRVAHTFYVLEQLGILPGQMSAVVSEKSGAPSKENLVRIRFFGN